MKIFLINILSKLIFYLFLWIFIVFIGYQALGVDNNNYLWGYIDILEKIRNSQSTKKIIFVGGSSVAFGVNTEHIQKRLKIETYNFGVQAGIGIQMPIIDVTPHLNKDDIVVISPEYHIISDYEKSANQKLEVNVFRYGIKAIQDFKSFKYFVNYLKSRFWSELTGIGKASYSFGWFNQNGDVVRHHDLKRKEIIIFPKNIKYNFSKLNEFKEFLDSNLSMIEYYFVPPPTSIHKFDDNELNKLDSLFSVTFNEKYPISIYEMIYEEKCFFDSEYHLTYPCKMVNTDKVLSILD